MVRIWKRKVQSKEQIEQEHKAIKEQRELFKLEIALQEEAIEFRELYLKWLDEIITLDDILTEMQKNSICQKLNPFKKDGTEDKTEFTNDPR